MSDPLDSARLKIDRARVLIRDALALVDVYTSSATCDFVIGLYPSDETQRVGVIQVREAVPPEVSLIVGDAVHNLRTALDHAVCSIAVANGKTIDGVSFPFARQEAEYDVAAKEKVRKLPQAVRRLIKRLKPYGGGNNLLHLLHRLDLHDKHRSLLLHSIYLGAITGRFSCDQPIQVNRTPFGSLTDGVHFATFPADAKFEQQLEITIGVTFADVSGTDGQPVIDVLNTLADLVGRIIDIFDRRCFG